MRNILVNARTQDAPSTGVQRYVNEMCDQLKDIQRIKPRRPLLGVKGHLWEQSILPKILGNELLWSPANTGPLAVAHQVVTIHDIAALDHPEWFNASFAHWYGWLTPRLVKRVQCVITVSEFSKTRLLERTEIDESKIVVIPNGVNERFYPRPQEEVNSVLYKLRIQSRRYVLSLGSIEPRKNIARLLSAWSGCHNQLDDDIILVVAGARGSDRVFRDSGVLNPLPRVQFTGFVPDAYLPALYSGALALIYPSTYEGFGLPVAEAMASGCVPVVSNTTALPEVARDAGITFDPLNVSQLAYAVVTVCQREGLRRQLRQKALRESERFSWDRAAERVRQVLEQAAA